MQKRGADGVLVHAQVMCQDKRHLNGMVDVGLAGAAPLVSVVLCGKAVRPVHLLATVFV